MLAPSFGGDYDSENKKLKKSYLTGIMITQSKALKNMIELCKLVGDRENCEKLLSKNLELLPLFLTDEDYFVKSLTEEGIKHMRCLII